MLAIRYADNLTEAGVDEAGRGCLAGPVVAAAVVLPAGYQNSLIRDSKKLKPNLRQSLSREIRSVALAYGIGVVDEAEIDRINILKATMRAMHLAVDQLSTMPDLLLIDGNRFAPYLGLGHVCVVKGDNLYQSIAAASILAKTHRDQLMMEYASQYPQYGFQKHKGYLTPAHLAGIREYGLCPIHRKSFHIKAL